MIPLSELRSTSNSVCLALWWCSASLVIAAHGREQLSSGDLAIVTVLTGARFSAYKAEQFADTVCRHLILDSVQYLSSNFLTFFTVLVSEK